MSDVPAYYRKLAKNLPVVLDNRGLLYKLYMEYALKCTKEKRKSDNYS